MVQMELVYQNRLVHFLGSDETEIDGQRWFVFIFRDSAGEKFSLKMVQDKVPNTWFGCNTVAVERALQEILDDHATMS